MDSLTLTALPSQLALPGLEPRPRAPGAAITNQQNSLSAADRPFHDWYRFVLSFPPHLVRDYLRDFDLDGRSTVLDPFCGTGTTLVEARRNGIAGVGLETNPFAHFASSVKVEWDVDPSALLEAAQQVARQTLSTLRSQGIDDNQRYTDDPDKLAALDAEQTDLLLTDSISPAPLHKTLVLRDCLAEHADQPYYRHALLGLANALVFSISNLRFGPEVGVGKIKADAPVVAPWLAEIRKIAGDLQFVAGQRFPSACVLLADARRIGEEMAAQSIDAVITSPPYPNEKDYTRTTRLESVMLGFIKNRADLRSFKGQLLRSNTRNVYKDDADDLWVEHYPRVQEIAAEIERKRLEMGKTSGFEKLYGRVTRLYFGGMARHFADLRAVLKPGASLAYVVGDQASYLRVMIPTGQILAEIAQSLGYELKRIDLFRTRFATATGVDLREEVVVLRWPGGA